MIAHRPRDADTTRRTLGLKPRRNIHRIPVQVCAISNRVANVDPDAKADGPVRGSRRRDREFPAAPSQHSEPRRRCCRTRPAVNRRLSGRSGRHALRSQGRSGCCAERAAVERSHIVQAYQAAIADHVSIHDGDQLPPVRRLPDRVWRSASRHGPLDSRTAVAEHSATYHRKLPDTTAADFGGRLNGGSGCKSVSEFKVGQMQTIETVTISPPALRAPGTGRNAPAAPHPGRIP